MKALIFAAGLGTRLKPLTETMPKALVPVGGKPLLEHTILKLKSAGVTKIIINVHHFANQIIDFIHSRNNFDIQIAFSDEQDLLLDTGGGIKKAAWFFNDDQPFFVHNVDILSNIDLKKMYTSHIHSQSFATLFVSNRITSRYLLFNNEDELVGWCNKCTGEIKPKNSNLDIKDYKQLAFNGIHVISPQIFPLMKDWKENFSIIDFYLSIAQTSNIHSFCPEDSKVVDVGKIETLHEAEELLNDY